MSDEKITTKPSNFIRDIIDQDLANGKYDKIITRFPPEPNGYLHVGHAKAIFLNYGIAKDYQGTFHLRFDDTNPLKEEQEYIDAIKEDLRWLGADWGEHEYYASDYFQQLYDWAIFMIEEGLAYVDDQSQEEIRENRGTLTEPGRNSPYRDRSVEENLDLFKRMKAGEFKNGERVLRAKINMADPIINMRDPVIYRILHEVHPRTGDQWCIYPMYDFTHGQSDAIEGITHSICTLEFQNHRPLYDWLIEVLPVPSEPHQFEFARLNLTYTVMSKRKLLKLVQEGHVQGWDDPRMPTLSGMRRRGYPARALQDFCERIGVAKANSTVDFALLENSIRELLNKEANRYMAVFNPIKLVIDGYPEDQEDYFDAVNNPEDEAAGTRKIRFTKEVYIDGNDFMHDPPKKYYRLTKGATVRLKHGYIVTCDEVIMDDNNNVVELRCSYDPESRGGSNPNKLPAKGTIQWISTKDAVKAEVRLYDHLFNKENPDEAPEGEDFTANLNPGSLETLENVYVEPALAELEQGVVAQFMRIGYFCKDKDSTPEKLVFNRTITLKDSWGKTQAKNK